MTPHRAKPSSERPLLLVLAVSLALATALVVVLVRPQPQIRPDRRAVFELDEPAPNVPVAPTTTR